MSFPLQVDSSIFTPGTREAFAEHLQSNPNARRISVTEKQRLLEWLSPLSTTPSSQKDFSRRNYARRSFAWDPQIQNLVTVPKKENGLSRFVVTEEAIMDSIEKIHISNGHAGWDATWKDISSIYYGILRADVIFLLKRCAVCAPNPRKRSKSSSHNRPPIGSDDAGLLRLEDLLADGDDQVATNIGPDF